MQMQNILILENRKLRVRVCARVLANHFFSENRKKRKGYPKQEMGYTSLEKRDPESSC